MKSRMPVFPSPFHCSCCVTDPMLFTPSRIVSHRLASSHKVAEGQHEISSRSIDGEGGAGAKGLEVLQSSKGKAL